LFGCVSIETHHLESEVQWATTGRVVSSSPGWELTARTMWVCSRVQADRLRIYVAGALV